MTEEWKPIAGYEGYYDVSNTGKVKSLLRKADKLNSSKNRTVPERILKPNIQHGQYCVSMIKDGKHKLYRICRLVIYAFGDEQPSPEHVIMHIDGDNSNNNIDNLRWATMKEVTQQAIELGKKKPVTQEKRKRLSEQIKQKWESEEYRKNQVEQTKQLWADPEYKARVSKAISDGWKRRREEKERLKALEPIPAPYHVPDLPGEEWRDCKGFEGHYAVSNYGRVKSLDRILPHKNYGTWHIREKLLKPGWTGPGELKYQSVALHIGKGKMENHKVHRLVAEAFIPKVEGKDFINHIDGDKNNNAASNLEWCTCKENSEHAWQTGLCDNIIACKVKPVINVETGERFESISEAERAYNVSSGSIQHALKTGGTSCGYHWQYAEKEGKQNNA